MQMKRALLALTLAIALAGCANMSQEGRDTAKRTAGGTLIGAAGGAAIGAIAGNAGLGAAGAGAGLVGGYLYDQHQKSKQRAYEQGGADGQSQSH